MKYEVNFERAFEHNQRGSAGIKTATLLLMEEAYPDLLIK